MAQDLQGTASRAPDWDPSSESRLELVINPAISSLLGRLADHEKNEAVSCLTGMREARRFVFDRAEERWILASNTNSVRYLPCPAGTIALWHSHPRLVGVRPEHLCYLSDVDISTALNRRAPPVQIVQV